MSNKENGTINAGATKTLSTVEEVVGYSSSTASSSSPSSSSLSFGSSSTSNSQQNAVAAAKAAFATFKRSQALKRRATDTGVVSELNGIRNNHFSSGPSTPPSNNNNNNNNNSKRPSLHINTSSDNSSTQRAFKDFTDHSIGSPVARRSTGGASLWTPCPISPASNAAGRGFHLAGAASIGSPRPTTIPHGLKLGALNPAVLSPATILSRAGFEGDNGLGSARSDFSNVSSPRTPLEERLF